MKFSVAVNKNRCNKGVGIKPYMIRFCRAVNHILTYCMLPIKLIFTISIPNHINFNNSPNLNPSFKFVATCNGMYQNWFKVNLYNLCSECDID